MSNIGNPITSVAFLTDQFSGNGSTVNFTMSVAPANTASILVAISGVVQNPSTYAVVGTTLTFSTAPPSGTGNISVRYLGIPASGVTTTAYRTYTEYTATNGQTSFSTPSYTPGFLNVYRNGVLLGLADYTATTGTTVVLTAGANAGDLITTESFYVSSVLNAIPNTNGSVAQLNLAPNVAGNGPSFHVSYVGTTSISANTWTKVALNTKQWDTANAFDATTNYRFQPSVAGYYAINVINTQLVSGNVYVQIYKNGSPWQQFGGALNATGSSIVYFNGSTDYVEMWIYCTAALASGTGSGVFTAMNGALVRAA